MTDDLKKLAEAAKVAHAGGDLGAFSEAWSAWERAATPDAILALIRERDEALAQVDAYKLMQALDKDSAYVIRELLNRHNVPAAAFVDDHVANAIAQRDAAEAALSAAQEEVARLRNAPRIEFHQQDWLEGFAAFVENATTPPPESRAFCLLNLGAFLATVEHGHVEKAELPYFVAESMMHEVVHALEQWAGVEFSEERVEALLVKYRAATLTKEPTDG